MNKTLFLSNDIKRCIGKYLLPNIITTKPYISHIQNFNKIYYTHDNGGRPFKVVINKNNVKVYKYSYTYLHSLSDKSDIYELTPYLICKPLQIFIGKSPLNEMTIFSGGYGEKFDGNSILLKMKDYYIYIGNTIKSFKPLYDIKEYVSHVGNSDVSYSYAIDINNNYYLMLNNILIKNNYINDENKDDIYRYYYTSIVPKFESFPVNIIKNREW